MSVVLKYFWKFDGLVLKGLIKSEWAGYGEEELHERRVLSSAVGAARADVLDADPVDRLRVQPGGAEVRPQLPRGFFLHRPVQHRALLPVDQNLNNSVGTIEFWKNRILLHAGD